MKKPHAICAAIWPALATLATLVATCIVAPVGRTAGAQIMSNPTQWYIDNQMYSTRVFNGVLGNSMLGMKSGANANSAAKAPAGAPAADVTRFREVAPIAPQALAQRSAGSAEQQEGARRQLDAYVALYHQVAQKDGFPANDLAYAFEYFVVNNYHIYHDLMDLPYDKDPRARRGRDGFDRIRIMSEKRQLQISIAQERAIYAQFRTSLARNAEIQQMTDAQKQEAAEKLAIMYGVNRSAYLRGIDANDDAAAEQARQMARQGLEKLLGVPVSRIKVTSAGLEL